MSPSWKFISCRNGFLLVPASSADLFRRRRCPKTVPAGRGSRLLRSPGEIARHSHGKPEPNLEFGGKLVQLRSMTNIAGSFASAPAASTQTSMSASTRELPFPQSDSGAKPILLPARHVHFQRHLKSFFIGTSAGQLERIDAVESSRRQRLPIFFAEAPTKCQRVVRQQRISLRRGLPSSCPASKAAGPFSACAWIMTSWCHRARPLLGGLAIEPERAEVLRRCPRGIVDGVPRQPRSSNVGGAGGINWRHFVFSRTTDERF